MWQEGTGHHIENDHLAVPPHFSPEDPPYRILYPVVKTGGESNKVVFTNKSPTSLVHGIDI
jgi:hypothetical protein